MAEPLAWLREIDAGTDNACWVVCAKGDPGSVPVFAHAEPDHCYDPDCWEATYGWEDRDCPFWDDPLALGEVRKINTLFEGPPKWVAHVPTTWDDDGDPDESEHQWFDSEEAANAARSGNTPSPNKGDR